MGLRRLRGEVVWNFSLQDSVVRITVEGEVVYEQELRGECKDQRYGKVVRFAFDGLGCKHSFRVTEMIAGDRFTLDCSEICCD